MMMMMTVGLGSRLAALVFSFGLGLPSVVMAGPIQLGILVKEGRYNSFGTGGGHGLPSSPTITAKADGGGIIRSRSTQLRSFGTGEGSMPPEYILNDATSQKKQERVPALQHPLLARLRETGARILSFLSPSQLPGTRHSEGGEGSVEQMTELELTKIAFSISLLLAIGLGVLHTKWLRTRAKHAAADMEKAKNHLMKGSGVPCPGDDPLGYLFKVRTLEERRIQDAEISKDRLERGEPQIL